MKEHIVERLEALKRANPNTSFSLTCERLMEVKEEVIKAGFDKEWAESVFDLTNYHDWVKIALKLDHLVRLFKGRVICVEKFLKEEV